MVSDAQKQFPIIDVSKELEKGSKEWNDLCKRVSEACEEYGCFEVIYDKIPTQLREVIFSLTKELIELPLEIKLKTLNPERPLIGYNIPNSMRPLHESFGIEDATNYDSLKAYAQILLSDPLAQHRFCETVCNMVKHQGELHDKIWSLILGSFGIEKTAESTISTNTLFRMMKYNPPNETNLGLKAHSDGSLGTLVCQHQCSGLQIQIKDSEEWIRLNPSPDSHIFMVGDALAAWSNGRFHNVTHQVIMMENKERYSLANFVIPDDDAIIKPQKEFIDENHPQKFKQFAYSEFMTFINAAPLGNKLYAFAGINHI